MNSLDNQFKYWDKAALSKSFTHPLDINRLQRYLPQESKILDYGCGYGRTCNELYTKGYRNIQGLDSSQKMIERGQREFPNIRLESFQSVELPFKSNTFDAIILFAVLTCIPTNNGQQALIKELHRVLRSKGILYVSDYWLQNNERNLTRYKTFERKYDQYGVFELEEGAVVRHHSTEWINILFQNFVKLDLYDCELISMNGNSSSCFQFMGQKT